MDEYTLKTKLVYYKHESALTYFILLVDYIYHNMRPRYVVISGVSLIAHYFTLINHVSAVLELPSLRICLCIAGESPSFKY